MSPSLCQLELLSKLARTWKSDSTHRGLHKLIYEPSQFATKRVALDPERLQFRKIIKRMLSKINCYFDKNSFRIWYKYVLSLHLFWYFLLGIFHLKKNSWSSHISILNIVKQITWKSISNWEPEFRRNNQSDFSNYYLPT